MRVIHLFHTGNSVQINYGFITILKAYDVIYSNMIAVLFLLRILADFEVFNFSHLNVD